jgi:hypothetical protein
MRAARRRAPMGSMVGISASTPRGFTLFGGCVEGEAARPANSRRVGGPLRTRRLRIGPPATTDPARERT